MKNPLILLLLAAIVMINSNSRTHSGSDRGIVDDCLIKTKGYAK